jgi:peptidoglycan hydrolase-like protein with peptidoglycan-binding domain
MAQDGFDFDTELALLVGDINGDGVVDARDARLAAGHNNGATMKRDPHTGGQMEWRANENRWVPVVTQQEMDVARNVATAGYYGKPTGASTFEHMVEPAVAGVSYPITAFAEGANNLVRAGLGMDRQQWQINDNARNVLARNPYAAVTAGLVAGRGNPAVAGPILAANALTKVLQSRPILAQTVGGAAGGIGAGFVSENSGVDDANASGLTGPEEIRLENYKTPTEVESLQQRLKELKLYNGDIDGTPGPATERAIRKYNVLYAQKPRPVDPLALVQMQNEREDRLRAEQNAKEKAAREQRKADRANLDAKYGSSDPRTDELIKYGLYGAGGAVGGLSQAYNRYLQAKEPLKNAQAIAGYGAQARNMASQGGGPRGGGNPGITGNNVGQNAGNVEGAYAIAGLPSPFRGAPSNKAPFHRPGFSEEIAEDIPFYGTAAGMVGISEIRKQEMLQRIKDAEEKYAQTQDGRDLEEVYKAKANFDFYDKLQNFEVGMAGGRGAISAVPRANPFPNASKYNEPMYRELADAKARRAQDVSTMRAAKNWRGANKLEQADLPPPSRPILDPSADMAAIDAQKGAVQAYLATNPNALINAASAPVPKTQNALSQAVTKTSEGLTAAALGAGGIMLLNEIMANGVAESQIPALAERISQETGQAISPNVLAEELRNRGLVTTGEQARP